MVSALHPVTPEQCGVRIHVRGIVQGVGFRPFVHRLARQYDLAGTVSNDGDGVEIVLAGPESVLEQFTRALKAEAPPAARIVKITVQPTDDLPDSPDFHILPSRATDRPSTQIAPDLALCDDCLAEMLDPANRRYRYPFTNCTNCGPRFTIVKHVPYDRPNTSMRAFTMCPDCQREYDDPLDRRFHAQPNACPVCGPQLSWQDEHGQVLPGDPLLMAARALAEGHIVAIKGLGGFHLAVDAENEASVQLLRARKYRPAKPLAIMVRDAETARGYCRISAQEQTLLASPEHPIVLLDRLPGTALATAVAPGLDVIGLMLPYTPLHHLLLREADAPRALVMTSGNRSNEPICTGNEEALRRLKGVADFFLLHDRDIVTRVDDSVARVMDGKVRLMRRARGYSPVPVQLAEPTEDILACGGEMKNTFCIVRGEEAYLSQHIGELDNNEAFDFYRESINHLETVLGCVPEPVACDLHPDFLSTRYGRGRSRDFRTVQHHHAHIGAVLAEQQLTGQVLGIVLDGTGLGADGTICGGEIYGADRQRYSRWGRLETLFLPGGDRAVLEPWRMAVSLLYLAQGDKGLVPETQPAVLQQIDKSRRDMLAQMLIKKLNCPATTSCGRLFDGVSALLGLCLISEYEGQAAMLLEREAVRAQADQDGYRYPVTLREENEQLVVGSVGLLEGLLDDLRHQVAVPVMALGFHLWLVESFTAAVARLCEREGVKQVVLAGGCMQNRFLFERLSQRLRDSDFTVFAGELVPMNDGGLSLGQAYIGGVPCV